MIEGFYNLLALVGFHHPIHPIVVHIPMGMVVGAVLFSLVHWKKPGLGLDRTAFHCIVLALIFVVPVYIAGLLDWQHVFAGDWNKWIVIKMILGVVLTGVLIATVVAQRRGASHQVLFRYYLVSLAICGGLGFSGGELLYGG
ncbi:DUF2231 domain-containing protein [Desulfofustis glycolicus]|uniref:Uncharacterized membrane protein n=1 Tax=Desulfofustis glycolicus DSM 9705 TaxID=1121409 RepID=A0A1M5VRB5_9BACT|nr:DUF2231 domain-containing protein [Desulfofustis glycolicus]MCB2216774.1 hypothetical protein [Desulfobulbaceae bacterium]SHH77718.1 Uncharacterized membrane protein [Desulfofustis glycolicus DSM 9705]